VVPGKSEETAAADATGLSPDADCGVVAEPYALVVPYWNWTVASAALAVTVSCGAGGIHQAILAGNAPPRKPPWV
jgi:hypothetical protein